VRRGFILHFIGAAKGKRHYYDFRRDSADRRAYNP